MEDLFLPSRQPESAGFTVLDVIGTAEGMAKHPRHNGVQFDGMQRLASLTEKGFNVERLMERGALQTVVDAISVFPNDTRLCMFAACVLGNCLLHVNAPRRAATSPAKHVDSLAIPLARNHSYEYNSDNLIRLLTKCMKVHAVNAGVQCYCLYALTGLSLDPECGPGLFPGVTDQVVAAMRDFPSDAFIQTNGCQLLWNLFAGVAADDNTTESPGLPAPFVPLVRSALLAHGADHPDLRALAVPLLPVHGPTDAGGDALVPEDPPPLRGLPVPSASSGASSSAASAAPMPVRLEREPPPSTATDTQCASQKFLAHGDIMDW